jgi:hypothetical protein
MGAIPASLSFPKALCAGGCLMSTRRPCQAVIDPPMRAAYFSSIRNRVVLRVSAILTAKCGFNHIFAVWVAMLLSLWDVQCGTFGFENTGHASDNISDPSPVFTLSPSAQCT